MFRTRSRTPWLVLAALALPGLARAQTPDMSPAPAASASAPVEKPKSELGALGLAVAGSAAGVALLTEGDQLGFRASLAGLGLVLVGPSLGHFYAGEIGTGLLHSGMRVGALVTTFVGFAWGMSGGCALPSCSDSYAYEGLMVAGLAGGAAMVVYDCFDAPRAARRHNAKRHQIVLTPAPLAGPDHSAGFGLHLSGRF